jgi:aspartate aminotransferase
LTVGDFDPRQFPIPRPLLAGLVRALENGETNYPPSDGVLALPASRWREYMAAHLGRALSDPNRC